MKKILIFRKTNYEHMTQIIFCFVITCVTITSHPFTTRILWIRAVPQGWILALCSSLSLPVISDQHQTPTGILAGGGEGSQLVQGQWSGPEREKRLLASSHRLQNKIINESTDSQPITITISFKILGIHIRGTSMPTVKCKMPSRSSTSWTQKTQCHCLHSHNPEYAVTIDHSLVWKHT